MGKSGESKGSPEGGKSKRWRECVALYLWVALLCSASSAHAFLLWPGPLHLSFTPHTAPRLGRPPWLMLSSMDYFKLLSSSSASNLGTPDTGQRTRCQLRYYCCGTVTIWNHAHNHSFNLALTSIFLTYRRTLFSPCDRIADELDETWGRTGSPLRAIAFWGKGKPTEDRLRPGSPSDLRNRRQGKTRLPALAADTLTGTD